MSWITPLSHNCIKPPLALAVISGRKPGDKWQCDQCSAIWEIVRGYNENKTARTTYWARVEESGGVTEELVKVFQEAWLKADSEGLTGLRTHMGLKAVFSYISNNRLERG